MLEKKTIMQTYVDRSELSLVRESLQLYLQNSFVEPCGNENNHEHSQWDSNILREDFFGIDAQHQDYILALLSHGAYHSNWDVIKGIKRLGRSEIHALGIDADLLKDDSTGFQANICKFNDLYIICFAGTNDFADFYANARQGLGYYEPQYFQAVGLTNILFNSVKGNVVCTGHSLGGGLASIAALASQSPCICFSPAGLAKNTVKQIGMDYRIAKQMADEGLMRFYSVQYDWLDTLQNTLPIPPALGNQIKMAYSEHISWKDWLPHRMLARSFIAHSMVKVVRMMCKHKPWNSWNAITGEFEDKLGSMFTDLPSMEDSEATYWQARCKNAISNNNIVEFSELLNLDHKPSDTLFAANKSALAMNSQFMQLLIESPDTNPIKTIQLMEQKGILHLAARSGRIMQSRMLLNNGLSVNTKGNLGNTPLHDALNSHALDVAELLLASGADWRMRNDQGYDCRDILNNHMLKVDLLTQEGKVMREKISNMMN